MLARLGYREQDEFNHYLTELYVLLTKIILRIIQLKLSVSKEAICLEGDE